MIKKNLEIGRSTPTTSLKKLRNLEEIKVKLNFSRRGMQEESGGRRQNVRNSNVMRDNGVFRWKK